MSLYVQVLGGEVTQCWDSPPPSGQPGWVDAIEVRPALIPNRQYYSSHRFDLTKNPVEIVYGTIDILAVDRKVGMMQQATSVFQQVIQEQAQTPLTYDAAVIETARNAMIDRQARISAAHTHDELDALS
jgi:hypothetical protein